MSKNKLTLQGHVNIGDCLRVASDKLTKICSLIKPKTKARTSNEAKALKLINELRSILEYIMLKDYGKEGDDKFKKPTWWQDIYYGNAGRRKENH